MSPKHYVFVLSLLSVSALSFKGMKSNLFNPRSSSTTTRGAVYGETGKEPVVIELQRSIVPKTPVEELLELSNFAQQNNISTKDMYGQGADWLDSFEQEVAELFGKEAAMFCPSGVMAQQIALLVHAGGGRGGGAEEDGGEEGGGAAAPPAAFCCHPTSHLLLHEAGAHRHLLGMAALRVGEAEATYTAAQLEEVMAEADRMFRPSTVILELPCREIGGVCTPIEEIVKIKEVCNKFGSKLHMDGARIWEAQPYYCHSFSEVAEHFDSVYVSFYKGIGGMTGAMLIGNSEFIKYSKVWLRRFGGNVFTSMPYALSALAGFRRNIGTFDTKFTKMKEIVQGISRLAKEKGLGEDKIKFTPTIPQSNMVHLRFGWPEALVTEKSNVVASNTGIRPITRVRASDGDSSCYIEWAVGEHNVWIESSVFVDAFCNLFDELLAAELEKEN